MSVLKLNKSFLPKIKQSNKDFVNQENTEGVTAFACWPETLKGRLVASAMDVKGPLWKALRLADDTKAYLVCLRRDVCMSWMRRCNINNESKTKDV